MRQMSAPAVPSRTVQVRERLASLVVTPYLPAAAVAGVALSATVAYAALARLLKGPHVFGDELFYADAGTSLAGGDGLRVRGESYGFGPVYPALLALVRLAAPDQSSAYWGWLALNAAAFALTAVPAYLLARRVLAPWWSVAVAALSVSVPSAFYVGAVMTESVGYLAAVSALLAVVLAVERPSASRQLVALGAIVVATAVRTQFASLYVTFVLAAVLSWLLRGRPRPVWRRWWPTAVAAAAVVAAVAVQVAAGRSASGLLGAYSDLAGRYPVGATARWAVQHAFDVVLYLGVLGGVVAPLALATLYRAARGRRGERDGALLATLVSASIVGIVVVSAFSASPYGLGRLHDRYLFYVVPLWLVAVVRWLAAGAPRTRRLAIASAVGFAAFFLAMPYARLVVPDGAKMFDGTGTAVWATVQDWLARTRGVSGRWALAAAFVLAGAWLVAVPRRLAWTVLVAVAASFVAGGAIMWKRTIDDSNKGVFPDQRATTRSWVDKAVPAGSRVTMVSVGSTACSDTLWRHSLLFTEFFNGRVNRVSYVGSPLAVGPPTHELRVAPDGELRSEGGGPLRARFVVVPRGLALDGRRIAEGADGLLVLWRITGAVRVRGATSAADVLRRACA
jgi:hypothetical protein